MGKFQKLKSAVHSVHAFFPPRQSVKAGIVCFPIRVQNLNGWSICSGLKYIPHNHKHTRRVLHRIRPFSQTPVLTGFNRPTFDVWNCRLFLGSQPTVHRWALPIHTTNIYERLARFLLLFFPSSDQSCSDHSSIKMYYQLDTEYCKLCSFCKPSLYYHSVY